MKPCLLDYNIEKLKEILIDMGEKPYRAVQIFKSLHAGFSFEQMTDLSKPLRTRLSDTYTDIPAKIIKSVKSVDGTEKFLFAFMDGNVIEGVLMRYKYGNTLCVSSQIGCRMNCAFCASGLEGLIRNLSAGEILSEVIAVNKYLGGGLGDKRKITNIVMMGSGEPLDNYANVVDFLRLVSAKEGLNISTRNISLSTSGLVPGMLALAKENLHINLTVSLHSPIDEERALIMPVAKKYSIKQILAACENYFNVTGRRYIFEYVLINGTNDTKRHADELISLLRGKPCHINLIRLNEVKEKCLKTVSDKEAYKFLGILEKGGLSATLRRRMGDDIDGACGQLRRRYLDENEDVENSEAGSSKRFGGS